MDEVNYLVDYKKDKVKKQIEELENELPTNVIDYFERKYIHGYNDNKLNQYQKKFLTRHQQKFNNTLKILK